jgi:hypothetical protein
VIDLLAAVASVFGMAFFSFWAAIPLGLALGLPPLVVIVTTTLSYALGVALVTLLGDQMRAWIMRRLKRTSTLDPDSRVMKIWQRYGIVGIGLAAPLTLGAQIGAAVGVALGAPPRRLFGVMSLCALAWSIVLTASVSLGMLGIQNAA